MRYANFDFAKFITILFKTVVSQTHADEECQRTGLPFKPLSGLYGKKIEREPEEKKYSKSAETESEAEQSSDPDDMADLYPGNDYTYVLCSSYA